MIDIGYQNFVLVIKYLLGSLMSKAKERSLDPLSKETYVYTFIEIMIVLIGRTIEETLYLMR